ncbi:PREDICTED: uncharacterized protein LOC109585406 isoform X1 [Amphimedon queenslandica]|uniref:Ig-like domain-containing protein n=1 Tax=Amphimedon queenslandica TaxID=400682 RepID=A0AAN0JK29_AMPQE|nr:PREDICTED: uncharacterized protein LOC109585406 isoform X1 [Amphimedon queenslandica]|eukprot:XP_019857038.1 PREDICTED: uncharacterized protein LOC109585406 isoform X1 [Amphimedon queenslandica]
MAKSCLIFVTALCALTAVSCSKNKRQGYQLVIPDGEVTSSPSDSSVKIGDKLTIFCAYPSYMLPYIQKPRICHDDIKNGKKFGTVCLGLKSTTNSGELVNFLYQYTPSHRGEHGLRFTCSNLAGSVELNLLYGPIISDIRNNTSKTLRLADSDNIQLFADEGDSLWLSFNVEANPPMTSNDVHIISSAAPYPNVNVTGSNVKLNFSNVRRTNAGMYEIIMKNTVGNSTLTFQLVAYFGPRFRYTNGTYSQLVNQNITLSCALQEKTNPPSTITFSTTANYTSNVHWLPTQNLIKFHTLVIPNSGYYNCTARNAYGSVTQWYILDIGYPVNETVIGNLSYSTGIFTVNYTYLTPHDESIYRYMVILLKAHFGINVFQSFVAVRAHYNTALPSFDSFNVTLTTTMKYYFMVAAINKYMKYEINVILFCFSINEENEILYRHGLANEDSCKGRD